MFDELGLNVARQPDNARQPTTGQPHRAGSTGETPDVVEDLLARRPAATRMPSDTAGKLRRREPAARAG